LYNNICKEERKIHFHILKNKILNAKCKGEKKIMATLNSKMILEYMKQHFGEELSKQQIAEALGLSVPAVTGTMNSLIKKGYAVTTREETVEVDHGTETRKPKTRTVKYHTLTEAGLAYDPIAEEQAKAAEKQAEKERKAAEKAAAKAAKEAAAEF
jgi:DNA-binding MarR family transcriptional regulator